MADRMGATRSPSAARAVHAASDGVAVLSADWTVSYVNPNGAKLLTRRPDELLGRNLWEVFPEAVGTVLHSVLLAARESAAPVTWRGHCTAVRGWLEHRAMRAGDDVVVFFRGADAQRAAECEHENLTRSLRAALDRSELLLRVGEALTSAMTLQDISDRVVSLASGALATRFAGIALTDLDRRRCRYVSLAPLPAATRRVWEDFHLDLDTPGTAAVRTGRAVFVENLDQLVERFPAMVGDYATAGIRATAHLPLMGTGTVLGTLVLAWAEDHVLSAEERTMMHTLAGYTAQALQRSLLFAERVSAAQALQLSLLPTLPRVDHLELVARYRPARAGERVGGDWFDGFHLPDGALALVIGDVVGHDMRAAASMGQLRNMLRGFAYDRGEPPSAILRRLDHAITGLHLSTVATVIMARVEQTAADRARGVRRLRWSNAGHPPPMVLRPDGTVEVLTAARPSPLLGLRQQVSRFDTEAVLEPGSTVLFYTDGLVERRDSDLETGMRRLAAAVAELAGLAVDELLDGLLDRLTGRGTEDDVALLAVRAHPQDGVTAPVATSAAARRPVAG